MKREIKFRAWDNVNKRMGYFDPGFSWNDEYSIWHLSESSDDFRIAEVPFGDNINLMQFTDLKDKNDVEIYEGDVIRIDGADEDEYRNGSPYVMFEKGCFAYRYSHWSDDLCIVLYQTANQMLIVGNIYENPELLS